MPRTHSVLGASSAHRWLACPGSIRMSEGIPKTTSVYAEEGTAAHTLAERCLHAKNNATDCVGVVIITKNGRTFKVTEEMAEAVQVYLDLIRKERAEAGAQAEFMVEQKFRLDWLRPGLFGTNDAMIGRPFGTLTVYDYKHGAGVAVDAEDNVQEMYYGLGAIKDPKTAAAYEDVELVIVQPRAVHRDGAIRRHKMSVDDLLKWGYEVLLPGAKATDDPNAPVVAGDHCKFCPAMAICPAQKAKAMTVAAGVFDPVVKLPPSPEAMSLADVKHVVDVADMVEGWLNSCRAYLRTLLESGKATSAELGYKLVQGRATRKWTSEDEAEKWLTAMLDDEAYVPKKVISPAQAEKIIKGKEAKAAIKTMVTETRGTQLAPNSDPREAVQPAIAAFTEVVCDE